LTKQYRQTLNRYNGLKKQSLSGTQFLQWALPRLGYRWEGFRKPRGQVLSRIRHRMQELELAGGYTAYREYLKNQPGEWETLDRLCDVTISKFCRDRKLWDYLRDAVLPELIADAAPDSRPVQVWSAGCCNGEEAYSLSMIVDQLQSTGGNDGESDGRIMILGTDRNRQVLARARAGRYPAGALKELTEEEIGKYFHPVPGKGDPAGEEYEIDDGLRRHAAFERRDIRRSLPDRIFDLVLCRNLVFTYFSKEEQMLFLKRLKPRLRQGGYLVVGANEEFPETAWLSLESGTHPIYRKSGGVAEE